MTFHDGSRMFLRLRGTAKGFTLIELLATLVVVATLGSISSMLIYSGVEAHRQAATASALSEEASAAMERMVSELRAIPIASDAPSGPDITAVTGTSISWAGNSLMHVGSSLQITSGGTPRTLVHDVSGFHIRCFARDGSALPESLEGASAREVWRIEVTLVLERGDVSESIRTRIFPRSLAGGVE